MQIIPLVAVLLLATGVSAAAKEAPLCSVDGSIRVEPGPKRSYPDQRYSITIKGDRTDIHDIGGIGTGISGRMYGDDAQKVTIGVYWPAEPDRLKAIKAGEIFEDGSETLAPDEMLIIWNQQSYVLKPCK